MAEFSLDVDGIKEDVKKDFSRDIITNPPYKYAKEFVEKALEIIRNNR